MPQESALGTSDFVKMTSALILHPQKQRQLQNSRNTKLRVTETEEGFEMQAVMHQQEEHQQILEVTEVNWPLQRHP